MIIILKPRGLFFIKLMKTAVLFLILFFDFCGYDFFGSPRFYISIINNTFHLFIEKLKKWHFWVWHKLCHLWHFFWKYCWYYPPIYIFHDFQKEHFLKSTNFFIAFFFFFETYITKYKSLFKVFAITQNEYYRKLFFT